MSINAQGREGEERSRYILQQAGFRLQQLDWLIERGNTMYVVEVKYKKLFRGVDGFIGTGSDISQIKARLHLKERLGLDTILMHIDSDTHEVYWQFLSTLETKPYMDTHTGIRIYAIDSYFKGVDNLQTI